MNVLGIIGDLYTDKFYFNSIKHIVEKNEIHKYLKSKPLNVFEIQLIKKADFDNYQKTFEYRIKESPRAHKKKNATKYVNKRLSKKDIVKVNSLLKHEHLRIEYGKYGKNTIQVYSNEVLIESKLRIDIDMYCKKPVDLAGYIVKVFKR